MFLAEKKPNANYQKKPTRKNGHVNYLNNYNLGAVHTCV